MVNKQFFADTPDCTGCESLVHATEVEMFVSLIKFWQSERLSDEGSNEIVVEDITGGVPYIYSDCWVWDVKGFEYTSSTQSTLCTAQCEALCLSGEPDCEKKCSRIKTWITNCDSSNCTGTCSALNPLHKANINRLLHVPDISLNRTGPHSIELSWSEPLELSLNSSSTPYSIIYIVEETHTDPKWSGIHSVALKWVRETYYRIQLNDICNPDSYRVMAVNQYGSFGFSSPVKLPVLKPGPVQNIHYAGNGVYYYINKNNTAQSRFMAILQWDLPAGWQDSDIEHYHWNPMVGRYCNDVNKDSLPIFTPMKNNSRHVLMTIGSNSFDCIFHTQVQAVSKCNISGPWAEFRVDLTDCSSIIGYKCDPTASDPPGRIDNVTLNISSTPVDQVLQMFANPYTVSNSTQSPLLINLHINWQPPLDKGSQGVIDHYVIRHGHAKRNPIPLPPSFMGEPSMINVAKNIHELEFQIPTQNIPYIYGVQVIAVGPGQVIQKNDWGLYDVRTIVVSRNDSGIGQFLREGKVLLDEAGLVIVYVDNYVYVQYLFDPPVGRMDNSTIDRLALQWGPLVGPDKMTVEGKAVVPLNQSSLSVTLNHPWRSYGIRVMHLSEEEDEPSVDLWQRAPMMTFTLPGLIEQQLTPLYITGGCLIVVILIALSFRCLLRHHHFKHLERRLIAVDEDVSEDGDHYIILRPSNNSDDENPGIPTVVADQWELPHCCLKMGRVLGSGAFGQVVKGRVSKTVLMHRGLGSQTVQPCTGTHATVAIKMLQDNADDRHTENFLKEINMMKDIGYHRNVVSILGCCTLRQPYCLVVEHMPHGDLLAYFRNIRHRLQERAASGEGYINQDADMFSPRDLLSMARQISAGMEFLSQKGFVHRDLAARNILVGDNKTVKIGDFGLARYIYHDTGKIYVTRCGGKLPLRWMSPEAIFNMTFSTASDIWSFGVVLYEIVTLGGAPYPALSNVELLQALKHGYRMEKPDNCCQEIYGIMLDCWSELPEMRPSFTDLCQVFTSMLEEDSYLEYFNFNVSLEHDYYMINTDGLEADIIDLDDKGIPTNIGNMLSSSCRRPEGSGSGSPEVAQILQRQIQDKDFSVVELNNSDIENETASYTENAFLGRRHTASVSSFDNGLYSAMERSPISDHFNDSFASSTEKEKEAVSSLLAIVDTAQSLPERIEEDRMPTAVLPQRFIRPAKDSDRTSASSDDVFISCPGCTKLTKKDTIDVVELSDFKKLKTEADDTDMICCPECGRLDLHLTAFDIHVSERNDSAICSTASDDSDHSQSNQSDSSMTISDVYLMPDSPIISSATADKALNSSSMKVVNKFNFSQSNSMSNLGTEKTWLPKVSNDSEDRWSYGLLLQEKTSIDQFLLNQRKSENDIWFICQTKF